jgi:hypothetical protein
MNEINEKKILQLFDESDMLEISKSDDKLRRSERNPKKRLLDTYSFSPLARTILEGQTPATKIRLMHDFEKDNYDISEIEDIEENKDLSFEYYENKEVGTFLESWFCANLKCPGCNSSLLKYENLSMPIVDIKCSNEKHDKQHGPKYYQIKSTESDKTYRGKKYFSLQDKYIKVGSTKYGKFCHEIKLGEESKYNLLIGYICIEYNYNPNNFRLINIDIDKSFFVIPNILLQPANEDDKKLMYYSYIPDEKIPTIIFNEKICEVFLFKDIQINDKKMFRNIDLNEIFTYSKYVQKMINFSG